MLITLHGYDNSLNNGIDPLMKGYDFTNRIKSSMVFEADSEIALVNATIERILEYTVTSKSNQFELDTDEIGGTIILTIPIGNYTPDALQETIQNSLDAANTFGYRFSIVYDSSTGEDRRWRITWIYAPTRTSESAIVLDVNEPKYSLGGTGSTGGSWTWTDSTGAIGPFTDFTFGKYAGSNKWSWKVQFNGSANNYYIKEQISATGVIEYPWSLTDILDYTDASLGKMLITESGGKSILTFNNSASSPVATVTSLTGETGGTSVLAKNPRATLTFDAGDEHAELNVDNEAYKGWDGNNSYCVFGASESLVGWTELIYEPSNTELDEMCFFQADDPFDPAAGMDYELNIGLDISSSTGREFERAWIDDGVVDNVASADGCQFKLTSTGEMEIREAGIKLTPLASSPTLDMTLKPGLAIALAGTTGYVRYFYRKSPTTLWLEVRTSHPLPSTKKTISQIFPTVAIPFVSIRSNTNYAFTNSVVDNIAGSMALDYKEFGWDASTTLGKGTNSDASTSKVVDWKATSSTAFGWRMTDALDVASDLTSPNVLEPGVAGYVDFQLSNQDGTDTAKVNTNHQAGLMRRTPWATYTSGVGNITYTDYEVRFILNPTNVDIYHMPTSTGTPIHTVAYSTLPQKSNTKFRIVRNVSGGTASGDFYQIGYVDATTDKFINLVSTKYSVSATDLAPVFQTNFGTDFAAPEGGFQNITIGFSAFDTTTGDVTFHPRTMSTLLGFQLASYVEDNGGLGFESDKTPNDSMGGGCVSPEIHIQLSNLPIQSLNGFTHREEKTLAVIPRYKTDDIDKTGLRSLYYHGCDWLLYSPLFFKSRMNLNEIHVKLTNNDGTPANDVDCCSLTLDIRPRVT